MPKVAASGRSLILPAQFGFKKNNIYDFNPVIGWFDWSIRNEEVLIDFSECKRANYQALALVVLYSWHLKLQKCRIEFEFGDNSGAAEMWRRMGARGWSNVLFEPGQNFKGHSFKPLFALRNQADFGAILSRAEDYTRGFDVEYEKTLRYVLSELLYNTYEHGRKGAENNHQYPSLVQFTWYETRDELAFIVADLGVGIKLHLERAYPAYESHLDAIRDAIKPQVSGTFGGSNPYAAKNNAGVGLFLSTNIIRKLRAEMFIVSGDGLLHISPRDVTGKELNDEWPGTLVFVTLKIRQSDRPVNLHSIMAEFRNAAEKEIASRGETELTAKYSVHIQNYFGSYAENKEEAVNFRDKRLLPAIEEGKSVVLDFSNVISAPHSFLSALLATPIQRLGMKAYKMLKVTNSVPEIRETIDFILDENT